MIELTSQKCRAIIICFSENNYWQINDVQGRSNLIHLENYFFDTKDQE